MHIQKIYYIDFLKIFFKSGIRGDFWSILLHEYYLPMHGGDNICPIKKDPPQNKGGAKHILLKLYLTVFRKTHRFPFMRLMK